MFQPYFSAKISRIFRTAGSSKTGDTCYTSQPATLLVSYATAAKSSAETSPPPAQTSVEEQGNCSVASVFWCFFPQKLSWKWAPFWQNHAKPILSCSKKAHSMVRLKTVGKQMPRYVPSFSLSYMNAWLRGRAKLSIIERSLTFSDCWNIDGVCK